jgi:hypothetical protein
MDRNSPDNQSDSFEMSDASGLTWANHPNASLRLELADYLSRGWRIDHLEIDSAQISRRKRASVGWAIIQPLVVLFQYADRSRERILLTVTPTGAIIEERMRDR